VRKFGEASARCLDSTDDLAGVGREPELANKELAKDSTASLLVP
jgi:hypothetical protein